ncbi:hypothetical protein AAF712_011625 [Marasmius tenuissimus]|uniref:Uncharacterized protein n=1 Tax=Marasmius tenuissimus TaxID=585030 RepID=A0ABR2ZJH7_9AGAR
MPALQDISDTESEPESEDEGSTSESENKEYHTAWSHNSSEEDSDPEGPIPNLADRQDFFECDYSDYIDEYQIGWAADSVSDEPSEEQHLRSDKRLFGCDYTEYVHEYREIVEPETHIINPARPYSTADLWLTRWDGKLRYGMADEAKDLFGFPDSPWSDFWMKDTVDPDWHTNEIGDSIAENAQFVLHLHGPYPGDELRWGATESHRIDVWKIDEGTYEITDLESEFEPIKIPKYLLEIPSFNLSTWYAKQLAQRRGIQFKYTSFKYVSAPIGDSYMLGLRTTLAGGIRAYPKLPGYTKYAQPQQRFTVWSFGRSQYLIRDTAEGISAQIDKIVTRNPAFNVVGYWTKTIRKARKRGQSKHRVRPEPPSEAVRRRKEKRQKQRAYRIRRQGDILAHELSIKLSESGPYPGDPENLEIDPQNRFVAWTDPVDKGLVHFTDRERQLSSVCRTRWLLKPGFAPGEYWGGYLARREGTPEFVDMDYPRMGQVLANDAKRRLTRYVPFPSDMNIPREDWYRVYQDPRKHSLMVIEDTVRDFTAHISRMSLLNPHFDLPGWYQKQVFEAETELEQILQGPITYEFLPRLFGEPEDHFTRYLDRQVDQYGNYLHLWNGNLQWEERGTGYDYSAPPL